MHHDDHYALCHAILIRPIWADDSEELQTKFPNYPQKCHGNAKNARKVRYSKIRTALRAPNTGQLFRAEKLAIMLSHE